MPVSNSLSKKAKDEKRARARRQPVGAARRPALWLPNKAGTRFVRDASKSGIASKRIAR